MNKNVVIVLIGGFVIAVLVAVLVQASLGTSKKEVKSDVPQQQVLVAVKDLPVGKELTDKDIKWQTWPEDMMFTGAIIREGEQTPLEALQGRMKSRAAAGQPMNKTMTVDSDKDNLLAAALRPGYRAVGVRVPTETIAGGLIGVGDNVDVLMTYKLSRTGNSTLVRRFATETILENVRILGINAKSVAQDLEDGQKNSKTKRLLTATIEVTPEQAEMLTLANEMADLSMALRPLGDKEIVERNKAKTDVQLSSILTELVGGPKGNVKIYSGDKLETVMSAQPSSDEEEYSDLEESISENEIEQFLGPDEIMEQFFNQFQGFSGEEE